MKKKLTDDIFPDKENVCKIWMTMRLIVFLFFVSLVHVSASVYSQKTKLNIKLENVTLQQVFTAIQDQSEFDFFYKNEQIPADTRVSVQYQDEAVEVVLDKILKGTGLTYHVMDKDIVISVGGMRNEVNSQQQKTVSGKVTDSSGAGLPGVSVVVKGTTTGVITDMDGKYTLAKVPENATIQFSFVGMKTQEIAVVGKTSIDVKLFEDAIGLEEVVAVGYGVQKKETLTGSVTSVKGGELVKSPVTSLSNTISGRLPGVIAVSRSGEPGNDAATIRIRGTNTLGNNTALIVVDGVPGRSLDRIDPSTIETISVLKDAAAAIYGAQAANGVILITTKRGKSGKPNVVINVNHGYNQPTVLPKMTNAAEYATALNEIDAYRGRSARYSATDIQKYTDGSDPWGHPNTDWFAETFKNWSKQEHANASVSGGGETMKYFVSIGAKSQDAYYKNSATKYSQIDFRSNLDINLNKYVDFGFDIVGRAENSNFPVGNNGTSDIFRMLMRGKPNTPAYWPNGLPGPDIEYGSNPVVITTNQTGYDKLKNYVLNSSFKMNIEVPWVKGLSLTGNLAIDKLFSFEKKFQKPWYLYSWDGVSYDENNIPILVKGKKGVNDPNLTESMEDSQTVLLNGLINYKKTIAKNHHLNILAGIESRSGKGDLFSAYRRYFESTSVDELNAGGIKDINNSGSAYHSARLNYFGRVNYNFMDKYLAEFVWRVDGSYIFPKAGRFGFFPGVSLGWRISEENFWKENLSFMTNFKLRASYGQTGNDRIDEWQYLTSYSFAAQTQNQVFDITTEARSLYETRIPNPNVTWEIANQGDIGFDIGLLKDKLSVTFDYFDYRRSDILWKRNASVPTTTGLTLPRENIGKVTNRGFDFDLSYKDKLGELKYQISLNGGLAKNKITFWDEAPGAPVYQQSTGHPIPTNTSSVGDDLYYQAIGIFKDQAAIDAYPHWTGARPGDVIFKDENEDGKITALDKVRSDKTNMPTLQGGLGINLQYKDFDFSLLFQGSAGAVQYIKTESGETGNYLKTDFDGRWTLDNIEASKPRIFNGDEYWASTNRNTYFLHSTDYVRLKNAELGYNFPKILNQKMGLENLRIYLSGFNLLTFSSFKNFDPENSSSTGQSYPLSRVVTIGLSVTF